MDLIEGINSRRSIRAFLPTLVRRELIEQVLEAANRAPSYTNSQPWEVAAVSGKTCEKLKTVLGDLAASNIKGNPDFPYPTLWPADMAQRSLEQRTRRAHFMDMEFGTEQQIRENRLANYNFYNAPCVLFLFLDKALSYYSVFDMGLFAQNITLAAASLGLGTCIQAMLAAYPDAVRDVLKIPVSKNLLAGIAIGYPDPAAKTNEFRSSRKGMEEFAKWYV